MTENTQVPVVNVMKTLAKILGAEEQKSVLIGDAIILTFPEDGYDRDAYDDALAMLKSQGFDIGFKSEPKNLMVFVRRFDA